MTQSQRFRLRPRPRGFRWPRPARLERIHLNRRCTKTALCQTDRLTNFRRNGRPRPTPRRNAPREIMRVGHISVQANHLHMIVEASSAEALANGMKSLLSSIARRVNKAFGRRGKLFPNRFHSQAIKSPKQMYNALGYVLKNMMRHGLMLGRTVARSIGKLCLNAVDPYSNANVFRGWRNHTATYCARGVLANTLPYADLKSWLATVGYRRIGLLDVHTRPGPRH